jgi:hypothetical protein
MAVTSAPAAVVEIGRASDLTRGGCLPPVIETWPLRVYVRFDAFTGLTPPSVPHVNGNPGSHEDGRQSEACPSRCPPPAIP